MTTQNSVEVHIEVSGHSSTIPIFLSQPFREFPIPGIVIISEGLFVVDLSL